MDLLTTLKLWKEVSSGPSKDLVLDETIEELMRLYQVESLARSIASALVASAADPSVPVPTGRHVDVQRLFNLTAHVDPERRSV